MPSLQQLLEAVDAISGEGNHGNVTVIVDATFGHRIEESERPRYEELIDTGKLITPPAGVIGRGDAFILEVADRADAVILSNDSFQEFHGTYDWLFTEGRLLGGKHVPGVGWIFLARSPVRGPTSRRAVSDAKRKRRGKEAAVAAKAPAKRAPKKSTPKKAAAKKAAGAAAKPAAKADAPAKARGGKEPEPYNDALPFIEFVAAHPVGSIIQAEIEQFSSHGAYVLCDGTRAYISLKAISDPPPRSAREVLSLGQVHDFVVRAIDTPRRGIDLAMPGFDPDAVSDEVPEQAPEPAADEGSGRRRRRRGGARTEETAPESVEPAAGDVPAPADPIPPASPAPVVDPDRKLSVSERRRLRAQQAATAAEAAISAAPDTTVDQEASTEMASPKKAATKKAAAKKAPAKKVAAKKAPAKKAAVKKAPAKKVAAKKAPAKKAAVKKAPAKKAAAKKAPAKKAATRRTGA